MAGFQSKTWQVFKETSFLKSIIVFIEKNLKNIIYIYIDTKN